MKEDNVMGNKLLRKVFAMLLSVIMIVSLLPAGVLAAGTGLTVLAFTSDTHNTVNNESANRLSTFMNSLIRSLRLM